MLRLWRIGCQGFAFVCIVSEFVNFQCAFVYLLLYISTKYDLQKNPYLKNKGLVSVPSRKEDKEKKEASEDKAQVTA